MANNGKAKLTEAQRQEHIAYYQRKIDIISGYSDAKVEGSPTYKRIKKYESRISLLGGIVKAVNYVFGSHHRGQKGRNF